MNSQELHLDHFQVYDVADQAAGQVVAIQGQFDKEPEKVQLRSINFFANPASKNGEAVYDTNAHLTWYNVHDPTPDPTRMVECENQFGPARLITGRSYALLAPTQKREKGSSFPERLDHYKLYQVLQGDPVDVPVQLEDQFGAGETKIHDPLFFGVPVRKWAEGQSYGIHNERAHLVFYRIYPGDMQKTIVTRDQFGVRYLNVFRRVLLGVPTVKTKWEEMRD